MSAWVRVIERLPEITPMGEYAKWVLGYNGHHIGVVCLRDWDNGEPPEWEAEDGQFSPDITHWMPLPSPPEAP